MTPKDSSFQDSLDYFDTAIDQAWHQISGAYDVTAPSPSIESLFRNVDVTLTDDAAEHVVTNMLQETIEKVDRFSPWYTSPASEFGLTSVWNCQRKCHHWVLTMDAYIRWIGVIQHLKTAIHKNQGVLQGILLVDELMNDHRPAPCVVAHCGCEPPRFIKIKSTMLEKANIICDACLQPFMD